MTDHIIYMDNAATTSHLVPEVLEAMLPYFTEHLRQSQPPSTAWAATRGARWTKAASPGSGRRWARSPREIYFTAGGSESDNWAIKRCAFRALAGKGQAHHHHARSSTMRSCTPASTWKSRALRSPICRWMNTASVKLEERGEGHPPGYRPDLHHVCQQRNRHHPARCGDRQTSPQEHGCAVPHRCGAGRRRTCPST